MSVRSFCRCDDLTHLVNGMVSTLEILYDQMVRDAVERFSPVHAPQTKIRGDYRLDKIVSAVEALAVRENEAETRKCIPGVEASVRSLRDPEALFKLAVHPLAPGEAEAEEELNALLQLLEESPSSVGGGYVHIIGYIYTYH